MAYAEIIFSDIQQLSLLGHAIGDQKIFEAASDYGVKEGWFTNVNGQRAWQSLVNFWAAHKKLPTVDELKSEQGINNNDIKVKEAACRYIDASLGARVSVGYDTIVSNLREWSVANSMRASIEKVVDLWNRKDIGLAAETYRQGFIEIEKLESKSYEVRCQSVADRVGLERAERMEQSTRRLTYGVKYLDDATGGIMPNDLVLIGAAPGRGKTSLVTGIAMTNAALKKRVTLFALEAEKFEIERRIKYPLLAKAYGINPGGFTRAISYKQWRQGKLDAELSRFEEPVDKTIKERYRDLNVLYRLGGDYGMSELERDIIRVAPTTDLIILDHVHYVDLQGENENLELSRLIKKLRDLALGLGKPIIMVAHMRKTTIGKFAPLVPNLLDFHGSGALGKIATTSIVLAPNYKCKFVSTEQEEILKDTWPTYFHIPKSRIDGSSTRYTGVSFFDPAKGVYRDEYAVGRLIGNDLEWEPLTDKSAWPNSSISLRQTKEEKTK